MKVVLRVAMAAATAMVLASPASAQINFVGFTNGCFGVACVPENVTGNVTDVFQGLTYRNSTFNVTTAGGFVAVGGAPGNPNVDNLGSFTLDGTPFNYSTSGNPFTMRVSFTAPTITSALFTATLTGVVASIDNGGVFINFDNTAQNFNYTNGPTSGSFSLSVNDLSLTAGQTVSANGQIIAQQTTSTVPEPSTYALMAAGLAAMGLVSRRRRVA